MNQNSYSDPACPLVNIVKKRTASLQAGRVASADEKNSSPLAQVLCGFSGCKHTTTLIPLISSEASPGPMMRNTWFHYKTFQEARTMEESIRSCHKMEQDGDGSLGWSSYSASLTLSLSNPRTHPAPALRDLSVWHCGTINQPLLPFIDGTKPSSDSPYTYRFHPCRWDQKP